MRSFAVLASLFLATLNSCTPPQGNISKEDASNPFLKQAAEYESRHNYQAAIEKYNEALQANPDISIAHQKMGLIYGEKLGDYVGAIYHYRRYLTARPDAEDRELIESYLEKAKSDFALTMPNTPFQNADAVAAISKENIDLKQALSDTQKQLAKAMEQIAQLQAANATGTPAPASARTPITPGSASSTPAMQGQVETHTIEPGDSLWKLSRKYYPGDVAAGVERIKNANPEKAANPHGLQLGDVLIIPSP